MMTWLRWARRYGFGLMEFEGIGTQYLWMWWKRAPARTDGFSHVETRLLDAEREAFEDALRETASKLNAERDAAAALRAELRKVAESGWYRVGRRVGLAPLLDEGE